MSYLLYENRDIYRYYYSTRKKLSHRAILQRQNYASYTDDLDTCLYKDLLIFYKELAIMSNSELLRTWQNTTTTTSYIERPLVDFDLYLKTIMSLTTTLSST